MKLSKAGLVHFAWRAKMSLRRRASVSPLARSVYFRGVHIVWRLRTLVNVVRSLVRGRSADYEIIAASGVFDSNWYAARYGAVIPSGEDPLRFYLRKGHELGHWAAPLFDTTYYVAHASEIAFVGLNPLAHYVRFGATEGRRPTELFDSGWYLAVYADVAQSGANPLAHFMAFGCIERRDPSPLFSSLWYLSTYEDVATAGLNPLVHYLESGAYEGRDPNPLFSSSWYISRHPEVASVHRNPLEHYQVEGWRKGYEPGPDFDTRRYLTEHPDVAAAGIDPLLHFLRIGRAERREQPFRLCAIKDIQPSIYESVVPVSSPVVDVIIPVYRGIEETARCIDSVYESTCSHPFRLIVINDCSPELAMSAYLEEAAARYGFELLVNEVNLGFVGTVNRGMALSSLNDVLLLNSDTEVAGDWLDRMVAQCYASDDIATVTPLSNNATICSYPDFKGRRTLSPGVSLASMDAACAAVNRGRSVTVPTGVGFCMLIRRDCMKQIGLFDEEAFGKGYGEENDFCMRAAENGWRNILAFDTFVFHAGEVSFAADSTAGKARGMEALLAKHPRYLLEVGSHVSEDPGRAYRAAITAELWRGGDRPVVLLISHSLGGGTERHVRELAERYSAEARVLVMRPAGVSAKAGVTLESVDGYDAFSLSLAAVDEYALLALLGAFPIDRIHVHHLFGWGPELRHAIRRSGIPFDFTVHDFYTVCPQISFSKDGIHYCGEPDAAGCNACILARPRPGARDIRSWRTDHEWVLNDARRVIAPSADAACRIRRYAPETRIVAIHHEQVKRGWLRASAPRILGVTDVLRVAVIGMLAEHKGRQLVIDAALAVRAASLPIEFVVIGDPLGELPPASSAAIRTTGRYKEGELDGLLASEKPDLVLFASQWPETYSYTLTAALEAGLPVIAPALGAFPERLAGRPWSFEFDPLTSGQALAAKLASLLTEHFATGVSPPVVAAPDTGAVASPDEAYRFDASVPGEASHAGRLHVLVVLERQGDVPSPCAHIRLVAFLDVLKQHPNFSIRYVRAEDVDSYPADVIVTQRLPVDDEGAALVLLATARRRGIPLIYDLDDNLYDLDEKAEGGKYRKLLGVVHAFVEGANQVWVSTPALAERLREVAGGDVSVLSNCLDPFTWADALRAPSRPNSTDGNFPVRIVYMGTRTHADDFRIVEPALAELKRKYGARVEVYLIGVRGDDLAEDYLNVLTPPETVGASYPAFVSWFTSVQRFDIGLSPLRDTPFNRCKSNIKLLDYSLLGIVPVMSDVEAYREVANGVDGFLVAESSQAWIEALDKLVKDAALRIRVASKARDRNFEGEFQEGVRHRAEALIEAVARVKAGGR